MDNSTVKDIIKSLKDNTTSRLKNPVVGAFVFAWTALNINGLSLFILVDSETKISMIKAKNWEVLGDFVFPFLIAFAYLIILPFLNMAYDFINDGVINFHIKKRQNITAKKLAIQRKDTVNAEIESDITYLRSLKEKDIDGWLEQRTKRNSEFIALKERYSKMVVDSSEDRRKSLSELSAINININKLESEKLDLEKEREKKRTLIEQTTDELDLLLKNIENREGNNSFNSNDIKTIRSHISTMRLEFIIWDEDIPF